MPPPLPPPPPRWARDPLTPPLLSSAERARGVHEQSVGYVREQRRAAGGADGGKAALDARGRLDTVGAVAVGAGGGAAAAVSSGGLLLKHPGRVGQAAVYGCGCWAQDCLLEGASGRAWAGRGRGWTGSHGRVSLQRAA